MSSSAQDISILETIRKKLWHGHASVMVGSGFSRNADYGGTLPPTWSELANGLARELYGQCSQRAIAEMVGQKNALQLAQEYETLLGRNALNDFIKRCIADDNLMPTPLFTQFLELPWNDVFTTNYDTLLERASKGVWGRKYDFVYSCRDLALAEWPRIVKLHGSVTSMGNPLIVTEEDYRTYPYKFAPFVNTVQQALMESSLCLVGFSGTDPNFLSWLGWVRDNLGNAMPPVYLLAVYPVQEIERQVFRDKNVIVVDLSCLDNEEKAGGASRMGKLCAYLKGQPENNGEWKAGMLTTSPGGHCRMPTPEGIREMEIRRNAYPRWVVMPPKHRDSLCVLEDIEAFEISGLAQLPSPWDLKGLYEFNWCREKCLLPLLDVEIYQVILDRYKNSVFAEKPSEASDLSREEIRQIWLDLAFAVYRFRRENGQMDEWKKWDELLASLIQDDGERLNRLACERVMMGFGQFDIKQISDAMQRWNKIERPPYWGVRHAAVLFELGEVEKGVSELENTLNRIRQRIPKGRIKNDYELLGLEGAILCALDMARSSVQEKGELPSDEKFEKIRQRLKELAVDQCNPLEDADRFQALLSVQEIPEVGYFTRRNFDTTNSSIKYKRGMPTSIKNAYQCVRFFEESCLPLYIDSWVTNLTDALHGCVGRLAPVAPDWAFSLFCRLGAKGDMDAELFFSQRHLALRCLNDNNQFAEKSIRQIQCLLEDCPDSKIKHRSYHASAIKVLLEILSRLSCKVSNQVLEEIFDVGVLVVKSLGPSWNIVVIDLFDKFFRRLVRSMNGALLFRKLPDLLYLASPSVAQRYPHFWINPFCDVDWHGFKALPNDCASELVAQIDGVIKLVKSEQAQTRSNAFLVLDRLHDLGILSEEQLCRFGRNILLYMGESGLPDFAQVLPHGYLLYLSPVLDRAVIESRIRSKYLGFDFKVRIRKDSGWALSDEHFEHTVHSMLKTLSVLETQPQWRIQLTSTDAAQLFHALAAGLNATLKDVQEAPMAPQFPGHGPRDVFNEAIGLYDRVFGEIIVPHLDEKVLAEANTWLQDMIKQMPFPVSDLALHGRKAEHLERIAREIMLAFSTENERKFKVLLQAYTNWCRLASSGVLSAPPAELLRGLIDVVAMRSGEFFKHACFVLRQIANDVKFTHDDEAMLMECLGRLSEQTAFTASSSRFPLEDRADYRWAAARLAGKLYKLHEKSGRSIPLELMKWKEIGNNQEELIRVRNAWLDSILSK